VLKRAKSSRDGLPTARNAEKFFARAKNFDENMLHKFNNFVQLPASDLGYARFTCDWFDEEIESRRELIRELPEATVESVAVLKMVRTAVSSNGVSAGDHRNLFMEE
jgi:hypothetical protein